VSDTGSGMNPEVQQRMFEPFFSTKQQGKGTGLGLSIIHGIVKQSGGEIWVHSEPGKGTIVKVYLPRVPLEQEAARTPYAQSDLRSGAETILLVEDEIRVCKLVRTMLGKLGYTVLTAANGAEAMHICNSYEGRIHLLMTDVVTPGMAGPDLAHAVGLLRPHIKVLFTSAYTERGIVGHDFLQKPFTPELLAGRLREILDA
jgi:CheY-like chemotaxis protein